jgi:hypothetical protein
LICNDALTGEIIWQYDHFQRGAGGESLASGVLTYGNAYDGMTYAFAKGPTEITVETPLTAQPLGASVLIQGTVMDMSPGAPNTPCVSDASQNAWMQYLHNNHPKPTEDEVDGVVVHLEYVGADGVVKDLTHVTSDLNGKYQYAWTPPAEGTYRIIATLDPTESYWSSTNDSGRNPARPGKRQPPLPRPPAGERSRASPGPCSTANCAERCARGWRRAKPATR